MERMQPYGPDLGLEAGRGTIRALVIEGGDYTASLLTETGATNTLTVQSMRDPREALRRLRKEFYDVIVVSLPVAQMGAEELYRGVAALDLEQASRLVFVTSDLADPGIRRFLTAAGRPFLTQPVDPSELNELVTRVGLGPPGN